MWSGLSDMNGLQTDAELALMNGLDRGDLRGFDLNEGEA